MSNLFNVDVTAPVAEQNPQAANEFRPAAKNGQGGVFKAYIRFLPNPKNPANGSIVNKYQAYVTNYADNTARWVDCPSSMGLPDPIQDTFFSLKKSSNPNQVEASKTFSRKARYASLIQVIHSESDPSLNGRVLVWPYGKKVYEKIYAEMDPGNDMMTPKNPFNMINGRPFYVKVKEVSGFNNFDDSGFFDPKEPIYVNVPYNGTLVPVTAQSIQDINFQNAVNEWLTNEAPSLEPYAYHDWDDETRTFVMNAITAAKNPNVIVSQRGAMANAGFGAQPQNNFGMPGMGQPNMGQPATAPGMPGMGSMPGMPGLQPGMPGMTAPAPNPIQQPVAQPAAPQQPSFSPAQQATAPGGFSGSNIPNMNDLTNIGAPSPAAEAAPVQGGINVNEILADIM